ncbi:MAG: sigma 54-interacting transcriptional regulator [Proteobacteria bacterium]|nr:sigma 54-interacting transcriptional regulator [Pseudomonadota bacterium]
MRLLIIGSMNGQIGAASKIAFDHGAKVSHAPDPSTALELARSGQSADLVMIDVELDIAAFIKSLKDERISVPVVAYGIGTDTETAVRAIKAGAKEYIPLPPDPELIAAVLEAVAEETHTLIFADPSTAEMLRLADRISGSNASILITGDSGTGKEILARYIHRHSKRADKQFVSLNCAAIPENLLESELFGHEKGAFTGATRRATGRFEQAKGGTLFLDEIGDMPPEAQTRLLRVLQEGEYTTVGGTTPIRADARIIAATHRDLPQLIRQALFREDLYFRLNVVPIRLPPLRERTDDIPELVRHFLSEAVREGLPYKIIDNAAMNRLKACPWPGNVRELENLIRRLAVLYAQETIGVDVIEAELADSSPVAVEADGLAHSVENHLKAYFSAHGDGLPSPGLYDRVVKEVERPLISLTLRATRGNQVRAADVLGLNRNTLRKKIRQLEIPVVRESK